VSLLKELHEAEEIFVSADNQRFFYFYGHMGKLAAARETKR
jgi:hypothetical protein